MLDLSTIAIDPGLAKSGTWLDYMGGRFLIARQGEAHQERLGELYRENAEVIQARTPEGTITVEGAAKTLEIYRRAFADTCLLDWDGIAEKGVLLKYTPELGFKILSNPVYAELSALLERYAINHTNYQERLDDEVAHQVKSSAVSKSRTAKKA